MNLVSGWQALAGSVWRDMGTAPVETFVNVNVVCAVAIDKF